MQSIIDTIIHARSFRDSISTIARNIHIYAAILVLIYMDLIWSDFSHRCECWMWICEWCCISVYFWSNLTYYVFLNLHSYDTRAKLEAWQLPGTCVDFSTSSLVDHIEHCKHRFVLNLFLFCSRFHDIQIFWKKFRLGAYRSWFFFHGNWTKLTPCRPIFTSFRCSWRFTRHRVFARLFLTIGQTYAVSFCISFFSFFSKIYGLLRLSINGKTLSRPITGIILFLFSSRYNTWPSA